MKIDSTVIRSHPFDSTTIQSPMKLDPVSWSKQFPKYDIQVTKAQFPRRLKSKKKRIRDKWLKKYGHQTVYTNCAITGLSDNVSVSTVYQTSTRLYACEMTAKKKSEGETE